MRTFIYMVLTSGHEWQLPSTILLGCYITLAEAVREAWAFHQAGLPEVEIEEVPVGEHVEIPLI